MKRLGLVLGLLLGIVSSGYAVTETWNLQFTTPTFTCVTASSQTFTAIATSTNTYRIVEIFNVSTCTLYLNNFSNVAIAYDISSVGTQNVFVTSGTPIPANTRYTIDKDYATQYWIMLPKEGVVDYIPIKTQYRKQW